MCTCMCVERVSGCVYEHEAKEPATSYDQASKLFHLCMQIHHPPLHTTHTPLRTRHSLCVYRRGECCLSRRGAKRPAGSSLLRQAFPSCYLRKATTVLPPDHAHPPPTRHSLLTVRSSSSMAKRACLNASQAVCVCVRRRNVVRLAGMGDADDDDETMRATKTGNKRQGVKQRRAAQLPTPSNVAWL